MRISSLLKCSSLMLLLIILLTLIMSIFSYIYSYNKILDYSYNAIIPFCIFLVAFIYAGISGEKGIFRGLEIWAIYFLIISIVKYTVVQNIDSNIFKQFIFIPAGIIGGVLGVNNFFGRKN